MTHLCTTRSSWLPLNQPGSVTPVNEDKCQENWVDEFVAKTPVSQRMRVESIFSSIDTSSGSGGTYWMGRGSRDPKRRTPLRVFAPTSALSFECWSWKPTLEGLSLQASILDLLEGLPVPSTGEGKCFARRCNGTSNRLPHAWFTHRRRFRFPYSVNSEHLARLGFSDLLACALTRQGKPKGNKQSDFFE